MLSIQLREEINLADQVFSGIHVVKIVYDLYVEGSFCDAGLKRPQTLFVLVKIGCIGHQVLDLGVLESETYIPVSRDFQLANHLCAFRWYSEIEFLVDFNRIG
ncbi:MAG: hypothetical protein VX768_12605 [Planctomycetota bacterium]|nr:hypothetical protein [Planctomycetota bacterium]